METTLKVEPTAEQSQMIKKREQGPRPMTSLSGTEKAGVQQLSPRNFSLSSFLTSSLFSSTTAASDPNTNSSESIIARLCAEETKMRGQLALAHKRIGELEAKIREQEELISKQSNQILKAQKEIAKMKDSEKEVNKKINNIFEGCVEHSKEDEKLQKFSLSDHMDQLTKQLHDLEKPVKGRLALKMNTQADVGNCEHGKKRRKVAHTVPGPTVEFREAEDDSFESPPYSPLPYVSKRDENEDMSAGQN